MSGRIYHPGYPCQQDRGSNAGQDLRGCTVRYRDKDLKAPLLADYFPGLPAPSCLLSQRLTEHLQCLTLCGANHTESQAPRNLQPKETHSDSLAHPNTSQTTQRPPPFPGVFLLSFKTFIQLKREIHKLTNMTHLFCAPALPTPSQLSSHMGAETLACPLARGARQEDGQPMSPR